MSEVSIQDLQQEFGEIEEGDLTSKQKKRLYAVLGSFQPSDLKTVEDHRSYLEILQKLRKASFDDMKIQGGNFLKTLRSMLSVGEDGVYSNKERFLYELIQNVDDCDYTDASDCKLDIQFDDHSDPGRIILNYNETGFTPKNVFGITGIAEASKNVSAEKAEIGEKGIGFKSVFGIAESVLIQSGMFSFRIFRDSFTVPVPEYQDFVPVRGTRLILFIDPRLCGEIYRSLAKQYVNGQAVLNKNPILFLNKLTHIKIFMDDSTRYFEFNAERKESVDIGGILREDDVSVSVNSMDRRNGMDIEEKTSIPCVRYTMPILYGKKECFSRYGEDSPIEKRWHNLVAIFPAADKVPQGYTGYMYSFLPTQLALSVPVVLHAPFKLDGSREFVDPQGENEWFTYTKSNLADFLKKIYVDYSRIAKENIIEYIPKQKSSYFFQDVNEKTECLRTDGLKGEDICELEVFRTIDDTYCDAEHAVAFDPNEQISDPAEAFRLLGGEKKLFVPLKPINMRQYGMEVLSDVILRLFLRGLHAADDFEEIAGITDKNKKVSYFQLLERCGKITLNKTHLEVIAKHAEMSEGFRRLANNAISQRVEPSISIDESKLEQIPDALRQDIIDRVKESDLNDKFIDYLNSINYRILELDTGSRTFVMPGNQLIVLSKQEPMSSFSRFTESFDKNGTFSATLKINQASEDLNRIDSSISNDEYLKMLREVRLSLKNAFGVKMYKRYIEILNESGADKNRFLAEILQNADDCRYQDPSHDPWFRLKPEGNVIETEYNEMGFQKSNVRALTAIGESTKKMLLHGGSRQEIGEKGVGFKSVFGVAKSVEIHSNGFNFVLTDEQPTVPAKCEKVDMPSGTKMIFQMKENVSGSFVYENILRLSICLRNLKELRIKDHIVSVKDTLDSRKVSIDDDEYEFDRYEYSFQVQDKDALKERNANKREINPVQMIVFYVPRSSNNKWRVKSINLYAGLPVSGVKCNVPVIIDAPLELTTSREQLQENKWNDLIRDEIYEGLLSMMEERAQHKKEGLDVLRFTGFRSSDGNSTWNTFDSDYLNQIDWPEKLLNLEILPVLNEKDHYVSAEDDCMIIPDFISNVCVKNHEDLKQWFPDTVIDTRGKSQYVSLLEKIGCSKASGEQLFECLKDLIPKYIANDGSFRTGVYAYLAGRLGNVGYDVAADARNELPVIPVKMSEESTVYISYHPEIYCSEEYFSQETYYVLDENILAVKDYKLIFPDAIIVKLTPEIFDMFYERDLMQKLSDETLGDMEKASYFLKEYITNEASLSKHQDILRAHVTDIPMRMLDGSYQIGNRFINPSDDEYQGPFFKRFIVAKEYAKFAEFLGCSDIRNIHYDDLDIDFSNIEDDDIEDIQSNLKYNSEILSEMIENGQISDEQIVKFDLQYARPDLGEDDLFAEEFPERELRNPEQLKKHIQMLWMTGKNQYIQKKYIVWRPSFPMHNKDYVLNMYRSEYNDGYCFCQMCGKMIPVKYAERRGIEKEPKFAWDQTSLCLCPTCSKDYILLRNNKYVWNQFIENIMNMDISEEGRDDVEIGGRSISFTATHLAEIQEIFRNQGYGKNAPVRKSDLTQGEELQEIEDTSWK